ncbi:MAG TPA: hypothetical protein VHK90_11010 [Thermoanaerobaculia bacterium]|nr:hypothetical protein [Thermoanaerobaculia bacterium]
MNIRAAVLTLFLVSAAAPLFAQEATPPDYSRESLMRTFEMHHIDLPERPDPRRFRFRAGALEFDFLGMAWRVAYFPVIRLPGTEERTSIPLPDAFSLTNTQIATSHRAWRTERAKNAELKRIEKLDRAKIRVETEK